VEDSPKALRAQQVQRAQHALAAVARRQHGLFTLTQALEAGWSRPTIRRRLARHHWLEIEPRVYRLALAEEPDRRVVLVARTLATGGVACQLSAAALFGLVDHPSEPEVLVVTASRSARHGGVRSTSCLPPCDVTAVGRIRSTSPARTIIDLGSRLPGDDVGELLDVALARGLVTPGRLRGRALDLATPRRRGCAVVLEALADRDPEVQRARNVWEVRVLRVCRSLRLPPPRCNHAIELAGRRRILDFAWPEQMVVVEFDGFVPHTRRAVFDDDRARQNDLVDAGWRVFRLTSTALAGDVRQVFRPIASALGVDL
jgi:very-short-patch-repair endonuclease